MRIGIAKIMQETSTFSPQATDLEMIRSFGVARGREVLETAAFWDEFVAGFLDGVQGEEVVGITKVQAMPAGPLTRQAQEAIVGWLVEDLQNALPLDGVLLSLHGAFASQVDPDVDGLLIETARRIVGPKVPIGVALDLHANLTRRMVAQADLIDGMHTHPHVDMRLIGRRVAGGLMARLRGEVRPTMAAVKIPLITPAHTQISDLPPLRELIELTRQQEAQAGVLLASVYAVQPWMDIPEMGWASLVATDGDRPLAERLARQLAEAAWRQRWEYTRPCPSYREALDQAFASPLRPVVIADLTDLMTGGGTGDSTWYLKELLERRPADPCYLPMVDPEAVRAMAAAGVGREVALSLGGKRDNVYSTPVAVAGTVVRLIPPSPGRELPESMGLTGVLQVGELSIVVFEQLGPGADPVLYAGAGLDPRAAKVMIAKSVVDFREGYKDVAKLLLLGEAPGLAPADLLSLEWQRVPRPIFPLDPEMEWSSAGAPIYRSGEAGAR